MDRGGAARTVPGFGARHSRGGAVTLVTLPSWLAIGIPTCGAVAAASVPVRRPTGRT